jgi:hypothetical protein
MDTGQKKELGQNSSDLKSSNRKTVRKFQSKKIAPFIDLDLSLETTKTTTHYPIDKVCF